MNFLRIVIVLLSTITYAAAPSSQEDSIKLPVPGSYYFMPYHSQKCLGIAGESTQGGAGVIQTTCKNDGSKEQLFNVRAMNDGSFSIVSESSGLCLEVHASHTQQYIQLIQWPCEGGNNQRFFFTALGGNRYVIQIKHDNLCLDILGVLMTDWGPVIQHICHGNANQTFTLVSAP